MRMIQVSCTAGDVTKARMGLIVVPDRPNSNHIQLAVRPFMTHPVPAPLADDYTTQNYMHTDCYKDCP